MHHGLLVAEPAIAAAYAVLGEEDPLAAVAAVVGGFHAELPLEEAEVGARAGARLGPAGGERDRRGDAAPTRGRTTPTRA